MCVLIGALIAVFYTCAEFYVIVVCISYITTNSHV